MNKNNTRKLFTDMHLMLEKRMPSMTVESLVFGENDENMMPMDDEGPVGHQGPHEEGPMGDSTPLKSADDEKMARNVSPIDAEIKPLIDDIRVLALKGISKLANNPTSESYILLKKIWMTVDKAAENANKPENGGN